MNDIKAEMGKQPVLPIPEATAIQKPMSIEVTSDGSTQVVVRNDNGKPIRYIPKVSFSDELKLKLEYEKTSKVDIYS